MKRIRSGAGSSRQQPRIGAPDRSLTPNAGLAVITELCDRLGVIGALDTAVRPHQAARSRIRGRAAADRAGHGSAGRGGLPGAGLDPPARRCGRAAGFAPGAGPGVHDRGRACQPAYSGAVAGRWRPAWRP